MRICAWVCAYECRFPKRPEEVVGAPWSKSYRRLWAAQLGPGNWSLVVSILHIHLYSPQHILVRVTCWAWGCSSVVQNLPSMCKLQGLLQLTTPIQTTTTTIKKNVPPKHNLLSSFVFNINGIECFLHTSQWGHKGLRHNLGFPWLEMEAFITEEQYQYGSITWYS